MVRLRLVFFGTPAFAVPAFRALLASSHQVVGVVTQPDRPRGRGRHVSFGPVKELAVRQGVPVLQPERLKTPEFVRQLADLRADLGVVAAYGKILPDAVLQAPRLGMINIHASLLPAYRGAAPVHRAVIAGERETGVSIMRVVSELDAGPVFATAHRPIPDDETSLDVEQALSQIGASLCVRVVSDIAAGHATETPQDASRATYAHRLTKDEGALDWSRPARDLHNTIRGLHPWPHAHSYLGRERILVLRSAVVEPGADPTGAGAVPGTVVRASGDDLVVATAKGALRLIELRPEGKRAMAAREFMAGRHVPPGARLTPAADAVP